MVRTARGLAWSWVTSSTLVSTKPWNAAVPAHVLLMTGGHVDEACLTAAGIPADLVEAMRASLRHAAIEIRQRNVQPSYTNIAIMGGGVTAAATASDGAVWLGTTQGLVRLEVAAPERDRLDPRLVGH